MLYKSTALTLSFTQDVRSGEMPLPSLLRVVGAHLSSLAVTVGVRASRDGGEERPRPGLAARLRQTISDVYALAVDRDAMTRTEVALCAELDEARAEIEALRARAEAAERRADDLEAALSDSEMTALELRSRVVCLHGKLATSNATVRYQSMTLALDNPSALPSALPSTSPAASLATRRLSAPAGQPHA